MKYKIYKEMNENLFLPWENGECNGFKQERKFIEE